MIWQFIGVKRKKGQIYCPIRQILLRLNEEIYLLNKYVNDLDQGGLSYISYTHMCSWFSVIGYIEIRQLWSRIKYDLSEKWPNFSEEQVFFPGAL